MCTSISKQQLLFDYLFLRDLRSRLFCWKHARPAVTKIKRKPALLLFKKYQSRSGSTGKDVCLHKQDIEVGLPYVLFLHLMKSCCAHMQARNQLGAPRGTKSFLEAAQIFKLCPTLFSWVRRKIL